MAEQGLISSQEGWVQTLERDSGILTSTGGVHTHTFPSATKGLGSTQLWLKECFCIKDYKKIINFYHFKGLTYFIIHTVGNNFNTIFKLF